MSSDRDLLVRGIAAAKAKEKDEARFYLEWFLRTSTDSEQRAQAWLWLSQVVDDPDEKRNCLEEVLAHDPLNMLARRGLAVLEGRLDPDEIIDPDRLPEPIQGEPSAPVSTRRFVCQRCGGKMSFRSNDKSLQCNYCGHEQSLLIAIQEGAMVQEHDFTVTMATVKGHASPVGVRPFSCQGCGASFVLAPSVFSTQCSYCGSPHVVKLSESQRLIPPEGLIPFAVSQKEAQKAFRKWLKRKKLDQVKVSPLRGLYMPIWTFDLVGEIRWQCYTYRDDSAYEAGGLAGLLISSQSRRGHGQGHTKVKEEGSYPVYEDDVPVSASHKLPAELIMEELERFVLGDAVPYDEGYLADWPAEIYQIPVSDASLVARRKVLEKAKRFVKTRVRAMLGSVQDLQLSTSRVIVESFKLILVPVWIARYRHQDDTYQVIINGQMGKVRGQTPQNWLQKFLGSIVD